MLNQEIINLYDEYTHKPLDRRVFLQRLTDLVGSAAVAVGLIPLLAANQAQAAIIATDDARLNTQYLNVKGKLGDTKSYLAYPKKASKLPAVIVIHENRGLNAHIEDVARRLALEGFLVLAPDLLSPLGGTPTDEDAARALIGKLESTQTLQQLVDAIVFLQQHAHSNGKVGAVGFCWGGGAVGDLAVHSASLAAGVVYYGRQPKNEDVTNITAPLLLHYGGLDTRINQGIPAFEGALKKANKNYSLNIYDGVNHAFNNDTSEARYDKAAAELAWSRTVAFFKQNLLVNA
ncbi:MAG: dienelactone hydrolase family protein [Agitococcus sp.]|nr:dienelactone hydrolase family protein [Agitococcus sp.]